MIHKQEGLAAIPLILGLAIMVLSTGVAIDLVSKNQNLQNKAAPATSCLMNRDTGCFKTPCCAGLVCSQNICLPKNSTAPNHVPCEEFINNYKKYCTSTSPTASNSLPCPEAEKIISSFCSTSGMPNSNPVQIDSITLPDIPPREPTPNTITDDLSLDSLKRSTPSLKPKASPVTYCTSGQTRSVGSFKFECINGTWRISGFNR